jgi:pyridoxal phosphate enzyme (YggS family)
MITKPKILENISQLQNKIKRISSQNCYKFDQNSQIKLVAVSKQMPAQCIEWAHLGGLHAFGENYVLEAIEKINQLKHLPLEWHFIGHLQTNKAKLVAQHFDWVESVDSERLAQKLNQFRYATQTRLNICIQVNIDQSPTKSGVLPVDVPSLVQLILTLPRLCLKGLMVVPDPSSTEQLAYYFASTRSLFLDTLDAIKQTHGAAAASEFDTLSMGMSADYELAIEQGSTQVRIGSAIFGERVYEQQNNDPSVGSI